MLTCGLLTDLLWCSTLTDIIYQSRYVYYMSARPFSHPLNPETNSKLFRSAADARPMAPGWRGREVAALLLFAAAAFLLLALASFRADPLDPLVQGSDWVGPSGRTIADWLVHGFGIVALLLPAELFLVGVPLLRGRSLGPLGLRVTGDLVVAIMVSAMLQVLLADTKVFGQLPISGNVGLLFGELMRGMFSNLGSLLVGFTVVGLVLVWRSSFSFIELCQRTLALSQWLIRLGLMASRRLRLAWVQAARLQHARRLDHSVEPSAEVTADPPPATFASEESAEVPDWECPEESATPAPEVTVSAALRTGLTMDTDALLDSVTPARSLPAARVAKSQEQRQASEVCRPESPSGEGVESLDSESGMTPNVTRRSHVSDTLLVTTGPGHSDQERKTRGPGDVSKPVPQAPHGSKSSRSGEAVHAVGPKIVERRADINAQRQPARRTTASRGFQLPSTDLMTSLPSPESSLDKTRILEHSRRLEKTLLDYGVVGTVEEIHPGPTVTTFEFAPQAGTKVSKVAGLADDLALGLSRKVRIVAPIPGKSRIGFEVPNDKRVPVNLRELLDDARFAKLAESAPLPVVLGRDIVGAPFYADLASLPHVIVAGATGSGKSVALNVMLASLLFRRTPDELRLLMIDPKVVELAPFDGIPHLLLPVVTDMKQAAVALRWAVDEMERRYQLFATAGTKNIGTYNRWVDRVVAGQVPAPPRETVEALNADGAIVTVSAAREGEDGQSLPGRLPYIVIVVDEFADLMMQQGKEVEASVARLAQKARAAGLHVVLATQRPSVDVITGMIKANFPSRIAFLVAQKVDSRTILDEQGAEVLLGRGDMLVKVNGSDEARRVQCPFISEDEVATLTEFLRGQGKPQYHELILQAAEADETADGDEHLDARFDEAVRIVAETQRCSTSWLQRKMTIGYNRAAKMVEAMEKRGIVGPPNGAKDREVLVAPL